MTAMKQIIRTILVAVALVAVPVAVCAALPAPDQQETVQVAPRPGALRLQSVGDKPVEVAIYSITGQKVKQLVLDAGETLMVELPAGYYIVKTPEGSHRVLVK